MRRSAGGRLLAVLLTSATAVGATVAVADAAAAGCRVDYTVASQWGGGFTTNVAITNLGDPVTSWRLTFAFGRDERVAQGWNATVTQSGTQVTAVNAAYNGSLATGAATSFGFQASVTGTHTPPASFALNGTTCTGAPVPTTAPTTAPPTTPPTTAPTTAPPASGWNPPANLVTGLNQVWQHQESTYSNLYGFRNYGWDQVMANRGYLNYCVRWDSSARVSTAQRDAIHAALKRQVKKWMDVMAGHNGWPYQEVPVNIVGWAVRDRAQLEWTDNSVDIYVNDIRENAPQCAAPCGRFFNQSGTYPNCPGGAARHYDQSLWLTAGFGGGAGGDWGQRVGSEYFLGAVGQENIHIFLHEVGHTFGLDDFYDWSPDVGGFLMKAGSATQITEFDKWMLRDWWRHLKNRYGY
ncbi:cellulose binding domain-containing protein [Actinoplanes sp. NPDC049668]|uniref:cellulose-binding domain-containing protein n=1 Tax=unclassified Actinoplanes TaxID=2626549 RepID=UPI0033A10642